MAMSGGMARTCYRSQAEIHRESHDALRVPLRCDSWGPLLNLFEFGRLSSLARNHGFVAEGMNEGELMFSAAAEGSIPQFEKWRFHRLEALRGAYNLALVSRGRR
jgi:hypothetical protein